MKTLSHERPSDTELIAKILAGDTNAMEKLMRLHNRMLYRTARAILRDDAEAEDAVQEAYLRAYRALATFRGESKLSTWLVRITANEALMRCRRNARATLVAPIEGDADAVEPSEISLSSKPESEAQRSEMRRVLEARIDALPEAYRAVFVLRALEELTVEETAHALEIPDATVRTRYFRARRLLRESMAGDIDTSLEGAFAFAGLRCDRIVREVSAKLTLVDSEFPLLVTDEDLANLKLLEPHAALQREIARAMVISPKAAMLAGAVTMNSQVFYTDEACGDRSVVNIVYPQEAGDCDCCVSVLAPLGTALLGLSSGHSIEWDFPDGTRRRLRVDQVIHRRS